MPPKGAKRARKDSASESAPASKSKKTTRSQTANKESAQDDNDKNQDNEQSCSLGVPGKDFDVHEYITICEPDEDDCGSDTCMCMKKPADHPDWKWVMMREGRAKLVDVHVWADYRNPDAFDMYTFNDHEGYGQGEIIEILEYSKAKDYKAQWAIVETLGHWMSSGETMLFGGTDDGERVEATINLVGTMFCAALNTLDHNGLLKPDSEILDISLMMALYLQLTVRFAVAENFVEQPDWPGYIVSYANEKGIEISGPSGADKLVKDNDKGAKLPTRSGKAAADRFDFKKALKDFEARHGAAKGSRGRPTIGGNDLDITKWTRAQRAEAAFDKKDPLPDDIVKGLEEGKEIMLARG